MGFRRNKDGGTGKGEGMGELENKERREAQKLKSNGK